MRKFLLRNSLRGDLALRYEYMQSFKPLFPAPTRGRPKLLHRGGAGQPGVDPVSRPGMIPWLGLLCQSVGCWGERCGRSPKGEPVSLCWRKQYPMPDFSMRRTRNVPLCGSTAGLSHRAEVDVLGGLRVPWLVFRRRPVEGAWVCKLSDWTGGQAVIPA